MTPFLVCEFGKPAISNLIRECFGSEFPEIFRKPQIDYIFRYLKDLDAGTVLLESQYVDKDYIDDYSKFYVRRFSSKDHKCARLHFFKGSHTHQDFECRLSQGIDVESTRVLNEEYLGFIVIKPLPRTFIGKTCLRVYPTFDRPSRLLLTRSYEVNLFGITLDVKTIAFQEQDKVVAACATTAIWSSLNAVKSLPVRAVPSCSEITTAAINFVAGSNNRFPSSELTQKQILRALDVSGFRHHSHSLTDATVEEVFDIVACYLRSGVPLILGADVRTIGSANGQQPSEAKLLGGHAAALLGCETRREDRALYIHDDRLGPFARASVLKQDGNGGLEVPKGVKLCLQEKDDKGQWCDADEFLELSSLIAVTDKKVRLPLMLAARTCKFLCDTYRAGIKKLKEGGAIPATGEVDETHALDFSIELMELSALKTEVLSTQLIATYPTSKAEWSFPDWNSDPGQRRASFLSRPFARFQWVGRFKHGGARAFLVLMDATEIPQGDAVSAVYIQDAQRFEAFLTVLRIIAPSGDTAPKHEINLFGSFMRRVAQRGKSLAEFLDQAYGATRAPQRLKAEETLGGQMVANENLRRYYDAVDRSLSEEFSELLQAHEFLIWVIDHEGTLLVGREDESRGHPTLTGFKPARVGGELRCTDGRWIINSKSGRYSGNYVDANPYLLNALKKFKSLFYMSRDELEADLFNPT